jgi:hypothetical protein
MILMLMVYWVASLGSCQSLSHCCSATQMKQLDHVGVEPDSYRPLMA